MESTSTQKYIGPSLLQSSPYISPNPYNQQAKVKSLQNFESNLPLETSLRDIMSSTTQKVKDQRSYDVIDFKSTVSSKYHKNKSILQDFEEISTISLDEFNSTVSTKTDRKSLVSSIGKDIKMKVLTSLSDFDSTVSIKENIKEKESSSLYNFGPSFSLINNRKSFNSIRQDFKTESLSSFNSFGPTASLKTDRKSPIAN